MVIKLNHRDFEANWVPGDADRQNSKKQHKPASLYLVELIAGNPQIRVVFVRRAKFGDDLVPAWMSIFLE
jgi:hypothetical protein